ncbi:MAG: DUF3082 domain-containing protein [Tolypothrix sp. T3-bin4]|nr:DUF3082 domain-containing protein [Tolypothrix sp. T3-bin4]
MTNPTPTPNQNSQPTKTQETLPSLFNCVTGALISGGIAIALYFLTSSIAQTFASKPLASTNPTALNISVAVRTLVVGISTLATTVFGIVGAGLVVVSIYVSIQQLKKLTAPPS